jgi:hypothetical protein
MGEGRELLWPSSGNRIEQVQATVSDGGTCNAISATLNFLFDGYERFALSRAACVSRQRLPIGYAIYCLDNRILPPRFCACCVAM